MAEHEQAPGRRERAKRDKSARIHAAASELFAERGYGAVTTQDIADRADVATGTLFRYASSKPELLLMVYNSVLEEALAEGIPSSVSDDPVERIMSALHPFVRDGLRQRENTMVYQRETLFGDPDGPNRVRALALVERLEASVAQVLSELADAPGGLRLRDGVDAALAARSIFSMLHVELIRAGLGRESAERLPAVLRQMVGYVLRGVVETAE